MTPAAAKKARPRVPVHWQLAIAVTAVAALIAIGFGTVGHRLVADTLRVQALRHLDTTAEAAALSVQRYLDETKTHIGLLAADSGIRADLDRFNAATRALESDPATRDEAILGPMIRLHDYLEQYYAAQIADGSLVLRDVLVRDRAAVWLQASYLPGAVAAEADRGAYGDAHAAADPALRRAARQLGWRDLALVESGDGRVVYDVAKTPIFQTSLKNGPYADTGAGAVYRAVATGGGPGARCSDVGFFAPSRVKAMFCAAPIFDGENLVGALVVELAPQALSGLVNAQGRWGEIGLGNSGDLYLVGADGRPRSTPRAEQDGELPAKVRAATRSNGSFAGRLVDGARGAVLVSLRPVPVEGLDWKVLARIDENEALAPLARLRGIAAAGLLLLFLALVATAVTFGRATERTAQRIAETLRAAERGENRVRTGLRGASGLGQVAGALDRFLDRLATWRAQETEDERRRENEVQELGDVLRAVAHGDMSRRAAVDGKLVGLAHAVNGICDAVADLSDRFYGVPRRLLDCGTRIQTAAEQISREAGRQADELDAAALGARDAAQVLSRADTTVDSASASARELAGDAREQAAAAAAAAETLTLLQKGVRASSVVLKRLGERAMQQAGLASLADRMASDANLIALNAAIEAARVGSSSPGFTPIADDLARLAERAEAARDEIARSVDALRGEVNEALARSEREVEHLERHGARVAAVAQTAERAEALAQHCAAEIEALCALLGPTSQRAASATRAAGAAADSAARMRAAAESVHAHSQTLVAIAADLPAAPGESVLEGAGEADTEAERGQRVARM